MDLRWIPLHFLSAATTLTPSVERKSPTDPSRDTLFYIQAAASVIAAVYVLVRGTRPAHLVAAVVGLSALAAVVVTRYVQIPAIGPIPSMHEPVWYTAKTASAVAEGVAGVLAAAAYLLLTRTRHHTGRNRNPGRKTHDKNRAGAAHPGISPKPVASWRSRWRAVLDFPAGTAAVGALTGAYATGLSSPPGRSFRQNPPGPPLSRSCRTQQGKARRPRRMKLQ